MSRFLRPFWNIVGARHSNCQRMIQSLPCWCGVRQRAQRPNSKFWKQTFLQIEGIKMKFELTTVLECHTMHNKVSKIMDYHSKVTVTT